MMITTEKKGDITRLSDKISTKTFYIGDAYYLL